MIRIVLVDDEPLARNLLKEYLADFPQFTIVGECGDGFEAVKVIQQLNPDLIFLDIQMPRINGFETLELLEKKPGVIFTTAFDEYALRAFEMNAIDYLLKPFGPERFAKAVQKFAEGIKEKEAVDRIDALESVAQKHHDEGTRIVVKNGSNILILPTDQVTYIEAFDDYVKIFHAETFYLKKKTMAYYEEVLRAEKFVRIHRSFILNIDQLTRIEPIDKNNSVALLKNGTRVPISRTGYTKLREILNL